MVVDPERDRELMRSVVLNDELLGVLRVDAELNVDPVGAGGDPRVGEDDVIGRKGLLERAGLRIALVKEQRPLCGRVHGGLLRENHLREIDLDRPLGRGNGVGGRGHFALGKALFDNETAAREVGIGQGCDDVARVDRAGAAREWTMIDAPRPDFQRVQVREDNGLLQARQATRGD